MDIAPQSEFKTHVDLDDEIETLLQQAEARLTAQAEATTCAANSGRMFLLPKSNSSTLAPPYVQRNGQIVRPDPTKVAKEQDHFPVNGVRKIEDPIAIKKQKFEAMKTTAGPDWFNLPRTKITPELRRDLQLLRIRSVLDPKRHYKKDSSRAQIPEFSQIGTLKEGPTEFYSARVQNRDRKRTLAEEVIAGEHESGRFKKKYEDIQKKKTGGKNGHYKALMARRYSNKIKR